MSFPYLKSFMIPWHLHQDIKSYLWLGTCLCNGLWLGLFRTAFSFFERSISPILTMRLLEKYQLELPYPYFSKLWVGRGACDQAVPIEVHPSDFLNGNKAKKFFNFLSIWKACDIETREEPRWEAEGKNPHGTEPVWSEIPRVRQVSAPLPLILWAIWEFFQ